MIGKAERKVSGGKMVKVKAQFNQTIETIRITGDFFLYPEEAIVEIEKCIVGTAVNEKTEKIEEKIGKTIKDKNIELLGFSVKDIAETIKEAVK